MTLLATHNMGGFSHTLKSFAYSACSQYSSPDSLGDHAFSRTLRRSGLAGEGGLVSAYKGHVPVNDSVDNEFH